MKPFNVYHDPDGPAHPCLRPNRIYIGLGDFYFLPGLLT